MVLKKESLFKTIITKEHSKPTRVNNVYRGGNKLRKPKLKKQSKDSIIRKVRNLFTLGKENKKIKGLPLKTE